MNPWIIFEAGIGLGFFLTAGVYFLFDWLGDRAGKREVIKRRIGL